MYVPYLHQHDYTQSRYGIRPRSYPINSSAIAKVLGTHWQCWTLYSPYDKLISIRISFKSLFYGKKKKKLFYSQQHLKPFPEQFSFFFFFTSSWFRLQTISTLAEYLVLLLAFWRFCDEMLPNLHEPFTFETLGGKSQDNPLRGAMCRGK